MGAKLRAKIEARTCACSIHVSDYKGKDDNITPSHLKIKNSIPIVNRDEKEKILNLMILLNVQMF